jgi:hypothetical protein
MKKIALILVAALGFVSCDKHETKSWDEQQDAIAFAESSIDVVIPEATGIVSSDLIVDVTNKTSEERIFAVDVIAENSNLPSESYSFATSLVVPANSYNGVITLDFDDDILEDETLYLLTLELDPQALGITKNDGEKIQLTVAKQVICNDYILEIKPDNWGSEITWEILDNEGEIVKLGGPYSNGDTTTINESIYLADGCYTFTIFDEFGDGLSDPNDGSYTLKCSIVTAASGRGNYGSSDTTNFCVNQL